MSAAVSGRYNLKLEIDETLGLSLDHADDPEITHDIGADEGTLNASSTPPATKAWSDQIALSGGSGSLDLTALDRGSDLSDVDLTGLKIQLLKLSAPSTNTAGITVERKDAVTGYNPFGTDNGDADRVTILPGMAVLVRTDDEVEDVGATRKDLTLTGSGTDALDIALVAG